MCSCWPVLKKGCCCSLETCCRLQGWLSVVVAVFSFGFGAYLAANPDMLESDAATMSMTHSREDIEAIRTVVFATGIVVMVASIISLVISALFLVGISKRRPGYIVPYVVILHIGVVASIINGIMKCVTDPLAGTMSLLVGASLQFYCMLCANSLAVTMKQECRGGAA